MTVLRSIAMQAAFYAVFTFWSLAALPSLLLPRERMWPWLQMWSRSLRKTLALFGLKIEVRGLENIPKGGCIVAMKHQSAMETIAILDYLSAPAFILKRELMWIPLFGWYASKMKMLPINRARRSEAMKALMTHAREALAENRQIMIYPEGTRRPVGIEPHYKFGVAHLYRDLGTEVVPVAVNTGLFWPRNSLWRYPGTAIIEFMPPIPAALGLQEFYATMVERLESGSDRLFLETVQGKNPPPLTPLARAHLEKLTKT